MSLKALKSFFIEVDDKPKSEDKPQPAPPVSAIPIPVGIPGSINQEMAQVLDDAISANNLSGFDYFEFRESLNNPAFATLPEQSKYLAVFGTAAQSGLTVEKLISSVDHYKAVISKKREEFNEQVQAITAQEVITRQEKKSANEQAVLDAQQKMAELSAMINDYQTENMQLANTISQEQFKIQQTQASFEATFNVVDAKLSEGKSKIQAYLNTGAA